jgi:hypothetical protein
VVFFTAVKPAVHIAAGTGFAVTKGSGPGSSPATPHVRAPSSCQVDGPGLASVPSPRPGPRLVTERRRAPGMTRAFAVLPNTSDLALVPGAVEANAR